MLGVSRLPALLIAVLLALASPLTAQSTCEHVTFPAQGGERYTIWVQQPGRSDSTLVSTRGQLNTAFADVEAWTRARRPHGWSIWMLPAFKYRGDCATNPVPPLDTAVTPPTDTVIVPPPTDTVVSPPVDTVTPPPTDTVAPPPVDTTPTPPPPPPPPPPSSIALWSPEWRAGWLANQSHPWWQLIASNCARSATSPRDGDNGSWCAIVYQVTGDAAAGRQAVARWLATNPPQASGSNISMANERRENHIEGAILHGALRPLMTPAEDAQWRAVLDRWAEIALAINTPQYQGGTRTNDEDQLIGVTMGMQCADLMTGSTWSQQPEVATTLIPAVQHAIDAARGGELAESYAYNMGSAVLVALGLSCLPAGTYHHGAEFLAERAQYLPFGITPDLQQKQQWWDEEHPRDFTGRLFRDMAGWLTFAGLTRNPHTERLVEDVAARYGFVGYGTAEPRVRGFYFWHPGKVAPGSPARGSHVAFGRGHLYVRTDSVSVQLTASNRTFEDHEWLMTFNASLYRDGEWVITSPRSYGQWPAYHGSGSNGISLSGLAAMANRGMTWADSGAGWWAIAGQTSGPLYDQPFYDPPPAYVRAANRVAMYTEVGGWSVLVTRDSVDMSDPATLPKFDRYRDSPQPHEQWLRDGGGRPETIWHSPIAATLGTGVASWSTPGGQQVVIRYLSDAPVTLANVDETATLGVPMVNGKPQIAPTEVRWQVRASTTSPVLWSVLLVGRGTPPAVSRAGDTLTVGGSTWTITSAGVVGP